MTSKTTRYQFITLAEEPRLVVATGHMRSLPVGDSDGVQLQIALRGEEPDGKGERPLLVVNIRRAQWLDGCRYLAANGVLPVAEMALPCAELPDDADPGRLAEAYARQTIETTMHNHVIEAPENHAIWSQLRRFTGQGFVVGWFAARRGTSAILDAARELRRVVGGRAVATAGQREALEVLFAAMTRFEQ